MSDEFSALNHIAFSFYNYQVKKKSSVNQLLFVVIASSVESASQTGLIYINLFPFTTLTSDGKGDYMFVFYKLLGYRVSLISFLNSVSEMKDRYTEITEESLDKVWKSQWETLLVMICLFSIGY